MEEDGISGELTQKILLVDDDDASLFITQRILNKARAKADVLLARNGHEALALVKELWQQEQSLDLILLDIHMPVMDGFEFLAELQNLTDSRSNLLRIVLLSSSIHPLDLARAQEYRVMDCIQKPLTSEKLAKFL